ncbi:hypothetical protein B4O97_18625 [Marispirochaeta aestuarii]|uniref:HTH cro/C1-type domain-containing protein n=1 Tax=Marispirochaeta aestuarii TaxID=1963862 RepID=A0A1Y1RSX2_9SPIO|nr:XRE family transcriptional regulator [Marispirochaeta aestuarii]ORC29899.1 hypothetical protein B4O97_18625 [Marispirochaeta aestuarii]
MLTTTVEEKELRIGKRIRKLRKQLKYTLKDVAKNSGFSVSLISKIENDKIFPSAGTLFKIAKALNTNIQSILEEESPTNVVLTNKDKAEKSFIRTEKGFDIFPYATEHKENKIQAFLYNANKKNVRTHNDSHDGQEFIYLIEGILCVRIKDKKYILNPGDSIYFDSSDSHECFPISEDAKYLGFFA